jgi:hypothetical protein
MLDMEEGMNTNMNKIENFIINGQWKDDLIWCPSQCYLPILFNDKKYEIYLRWRWDDPWQASLIEYDEHGYELFDWTNLFIEESDYFVDKELEICKTRAILRAKEYLYKC